MIVVNPKGHGPTEYGDQGRYKPRERPTFILPLGMYS